MAEARDIEDDAEEEAEEETEEDEDKEAGSAKVPPTTLFG